MNDKMKGFIELAKADFNQAMHLIDFMPGAKEAILKFTRPGGNIQHRRFFFDAASDPETDPELLHTIGIRDLPSKIRYAIIDNPSTERRTIEKMASQTNNDDVQRRAKEFLQPKGDMMESNGDVLNKILMIMDGSIEGALQALNLSMNFGLEDEVLKKLPPVSYEMSEATLTNLAAAKSTPKEILRKLYEEAMAGLFVKPIYMTQLKTPDDSWIFEGILYNIARNPSTPKEILIELATYDKVLNIDETLHFDHAPSVRYHLVMNDNVPEEALMVLVNDEEDDVRGIAKDKLGGGIMKESTFKLSTIDIRQIIVKELQKLL